MNMFLTVGSVRFLLFVYLFVFSIHHYVDPFLLGQNILLFLKMSFLNLFTSSSLCLFLLIVWGNFEHFWVDPPSLNNYFIYLVF